MEDKLLKIIGMVFTAFGFFIFVSGWNTTDGILLMILGELVNLPERLKIK